jgi:hypothetical protein
MDCGLWYVPDSDPVLSILYCSGYKNRTPVPLFRARSGELSPESGLAGGGKKKKATFSSPLRLQERNTTQLRKGKFFEDASN